MIENRHQFTEFTVSILYAVLFSCWIPSLGHAEEIEITVMTPYEIEGPLTLEVKHMDVNGSLQSGAVKPDRIIANEPMILTVVSCTEFDRLVIEAANYFAFDRAVVSCAPNPVTIELSTLEFATHFPYYTNPDEEIASGRLYVFDNTVSVRRATRYSDSDPLAAMNTAIQSGDWAAVAYAANEVGWQERAGDLGPGYQYLAQDAARRAITDLGIGEVIGPDEYFEASGSGGCG
jgi:hypothetical protein